MKIYAALEAVLFVNGSPLSKEKLLELLCVDKYELAEAIEHLTKKYNQNPESGLALIMVEDCCQLCTKSEVADYVKRVLEMRRTPPLSKAALEVLAIISYNQPVTKSFVEMVRGIDSAYIVNSLLDKGLICEQGTLDAPGRPTIFGTTDNFLRCFGLKSIDDLPKPDNNQPEEITLEESMEENEKSEVME